MKRIFIGIDGTGNSAYFDKFASNVYRMNLALNYNNADGTPQLFFYFSGVGTSSYKYLDLFGKAFGEGIDELILQAYVNLVTNYVPGDKIYVFGFSRGSVAARALTGLISRSGLLLNENSPLIAEAWHYFLDDESAGNYQDQKPHVTHRNVAIEFLGVWDTVYGIAPDRALRRNAFMQLRFKNFHLDRSVKVGVHILSIDDTRKFFWPMTWDNVTEPGQAMEQIWMPGVHSDIGGGYEKSFLSKVSFLAMIDRLKQYCPDLTFDADYLDDAVEYLRDPANDFAINDEWKEYTAFLHRSSHRPCSSGVTLYRQSAHPLLGAISEKEIFCRSKIMKYTPSYVLLPVGGALPVAVFPPGSYTADGVMPAIKMRFP